jgi:hypothetical protein
MKSSIICDIACSLVRKQCLPKSYHGDVNYHKTLNTIFSVASICGCPWRPSFMTMFVHLFIKSVI